MVRDRVYCWFAGPERVGKMPRGRVCPWKFERSMQIYASGTALTLSTCPEDFRTQ